jgi:hypothetical protein
MTPVETPVMTIPENTCRTPVETPIKCLKKFRRNLPV